MEKDHLPHPDTVADAGRLPEHFVQWIWKEQFLNADELCCADGRRVTVLDPGERVGGPGPDFRNAVLVIEGFRMQGDVEIHVMSGDWDRHRHSGDFVYNRVILHAFLWAEDQALTEELHNGIRVPRLELGAFLEPDLTSLLQCYDNEDAERETEAQAGTEPTECLCHDPFAQLSPSEQENVLRTFGRARVEERIKRFMDGARGIDIEEAFWRSFLSSLAFGASRPLMYTLAMRVPVKELLDYTRDIKDSERLSLAVTSVLLHVAGLFPSQDDGPFDADAQTWLDGAEEIWNALSGLYADRVMKPFKAWRAHMRPANFPERRFAGVGQLLSRPRFGRGLLTSLVAEIKALAPLAVMRPKEYQKLCAMLNSMLVVDGKNTFWGYRYTLKSKMLASPMQLIGDDRAATLMFNVVLPYALIVARQTNDAALEEQTLRVLSHWPALSENAVCRRMRERLVGANAKKKPRLEIYQQGLIFIDRNYCDRSLCSECPLPAKLRGKHAGR